MPNAGIAPSLPFLMRLRIKSSLRAVFISCGPLPATRPLSVWHQPQVVAQKAAGHPVWTMAPRRMPAPLLAAPAPNQEKAP